MERLCCAKFCANALHALSSLRSISKGAERLVKVIWGLPFSSNPNAIGMAAWDICLRSYSPWVGGV